MKDTKSFSLLLVSSFLLLLSIVLLGTLGYQYYHQTTESKPGIQKAKAVVTLPDNSRDSLLKIYTQVIKSIDNRLDTSRYIADSLKSNLDINLKEFYRLRNEIAALLQNKATTADVTLAGKKITELQQKTEKPRYTNTDVENENKKLNAIVTQLTVQPLQGIDKNINQLPVENTTAPNKEPASTVSAANLNLSTVAGDDDQDPNDTKQAEKIQCSFTVKNQGNNNGKYDIVVVVLQPDGQVLQKSAWESGAFETNEGKKIYSCKFRCDAPKGESKQLSFSLNADNYQKGNYTMQVYHNGVMIGKKNKILS